MTTSVQITPATQDVLIAVDSASGDVELTITAAETVLYVNEGTPGSVDTTSAQTLENKTFTAPVINDPTGLVKADVGLGNVDDTADADKPVSTATLTALNLKAPLASPALTGTPTAPTASPGTSTTQLATTAFVAGVTSGGLQTCWIPAGAMVSRTANGAAAGSVETTTNKNMFKTLDFDAAVVEYAQFGIQMPKSWDEGTVTAAFVWTHAATTTNFGAAWSLQAVATSDGDSGDAAFGTAQTAVDTGGTTNTIYVSPVTAAITIAGTPAANDYVMFQVARQVADGGDTMAIDARLHGVQIYYTTDAPTDA